MRDKIKEKFWAFGDDFYILDENGERAFFVDGEDDVSILATCIVIDQVLHDEKD